jgi:hypothetical protein
LNISVSPHEYVIGLRGLGVLWLVARVGDPF